MSLKKTQHYVPKFWLKRFANARGHLYARIDNNVQVRAAGHLMAEDWLYTIYNAKWQPSNALEDALSDRESIFARVFRTVDAHGYVVTSAERDVLCEFVALQACRHPDVMKRGLNLAYKYAVQFAKVHQFNNFKDFNSNLIKCFGPGTEITKDEHKNALGSSENELETAVNFMKDMSPQDPRFCMQHVLLAACQIMPIIANLDLVILDAPSGSSYLLGDTPLPQSEFSGGFVLPLSKTIALEGAPAVGTTPTTSRRLATQKEVDDTNETQWADAARTVVGPCRALLNSLPNV